MKRAVTPALFAALCLGATLILLMMEWPHRILAQSCLPASYTNAVLPWAPNSQVQYSFDPSGSAAGNPLNPAPNFSLSPSMQTSVATGVQSWNGNSNLNGTGVIFQTSTTAGHQFPWVITTAWPQATETFTASNGQTYTYTVNATPSPGSPTPVAVTFYLPDHSASGAVMTTAGAAVTLINTNGTYTGPDAKTYPVWNPNGPNFSNALQEIGTHEAGHGFGLGDQSQCGDVMSPWGPATPSNPAGGTNNQGGCASSVITNCDNQEILNNPNGLYAPPPPPEPCAVPGCLNWDPTSCTCLDATGWPYSPIIIDVGGHGFSLTSAVSGVVFDMSGTSHPIQTAWTAPGAENAFLALPGADGLVHSGQQLFGNFTPQPPSATPNGFAALAVFDLPANGGNGDGIIDSRDAVFASLRLWIDANHDGISQPEELHTLPSLGVNSISLNYKLDRRTDQYGNVFRYRAQVNPGGATNTGRMAYDVFFVTLPPLTAKNISPSLIPADAHKCSVPVPTKGGTLSTTGRL